MVAQITQLPVAPSRQRPAEFSNEADAFLGALPGFGNEANALAVEVSNNTNIVSVASSEATSAASTAVSAKDITVAAKEQVVAIDNYWQPLQLGPKSAPPTSDNQGNPLVVGSEYYDTTLKARYSWNGTAWAVGTNVTAGVSQVSGKSGILSIEDTSFPQATEQELLDGQEAQLKSYSPKDLRTATIGAASELAQVLPDLLPEAIPKGVTVVSANKLPEPDWLRLGANYLRSSYPITSAALGKVPYNQRLGGVTSPSPFGNLNPSRVASSAEAGVFVVPTEGSILRTVLVSPEGVASFGTDYIFGNGLPTVIGFSCAMTPDGSYLLMAYTSYNQNTATYSSGTDLLKRAGGTWTKVASVFPTVSTAVYRNGVAISDDATRLWVSHPTVDITSARFKEYTHDLQTNIVTDIGVPATQIPPQTAYVNFMHYYAGKLFVVWDNVPIGEARSAVYGTNNGFTLLSQPYLTESGDSGVFYKAAVTSDRSGLAILNSNNTRFRTFDMNSLSTKISKVSTEGTVAALFFPEDSVDRVGWRVASSQSYSVEYSDILGTTGPTTGAYPLSNLNGSLIVNLRKDQLIGEPSNTAIDVIGRPATFAINQNIFPNGTTSFSTVTYPYYSFIRSLD